MMWRLCCGHLGIWVPLPGLPDKLRAIKIFYLTAKRLQGDLETADVSVFRPGLFPINLLQSVAKISGFVSAPKKVLEKVVE